MWNNKHLIHLGFQYKIRFEEKALLETLWWFIYLFSFERVSNNIIIRVHRWESCPLLETLGLYQWHVLFSEQNPNPNPNPIPRFDDFTLPSQSLWMMDRISFRPIPKLEKKGHQELMLMWPWPCKTRKLGLRPITPSVQRMSNGGDGDSERL